MSHRLVKSSLGRVETGHLDCPCLLVRYTSTHCPTQNQRIVLLIVSTCTFDTHFRSRTNHRFRVREPVNCRSSAGHLYLDSSGFIALRSLQDPFPMFLETHLRWRKLPEPRLPRPGGWWRQYVSFVCLGRTVQLKILRARGRVY